MRSPGSFTKQALENLNNNISLRFGHHKDCQMQQNMSRKEAFVYNIGIYFSAQLNEIRKTNIARLACDNADGIKAIQPRAFENVGP